MTIDMTSFRPKKELRTKYELIAFLVVLLIWGIFSGFVALIGYTAEGDSAEIDARYVPIIILVATVILVVIEIIAAILIWKYYDTILFEVLDDEIHVNRGLITKSRKIVPYRTITNLEIKRGPFDVLFGIGTLEIQTAGNSATTTGPEERIDGIPAEELERIQHYVLSQVRKITGSPGTSHDSDLPPETVILQGILNEVRELRSHIMEMSKES